MSKANTPLADPSVGGNTKQLHRDLEREPYVAVRRGDVVFQGWRIKRSVARSLMDGKPRPLAADDIRPNLKQKGVDMRIGLDIASLALKRLVGHVVVVTADADMIPALKLARREGLQVYLDSLSSRGSEELRIHSDYVFPVRWQA